MNVRLRFDLGSLTLRKVALALGAGIVLAAIAAGVLAPHAYLSFARGFRWAAVAGATIGVLLGFAPRRFHVLATAILVAAIAAYDAVFVPSALAMLFGLASAPGMIFQEPVAGAVVFLGGEMLFLIPQFGFVLLLVRGLPQGWSTPIWKSPEDRSAVGSGGAADNVVPLRRRQGGGG